MAASKSLVWKGDAVTARMRAAQIQGVNDTMGASVIYAKQHHPWQNRTTVLEGGIDVVDYAAQDGQGVRGVWGVRDVRYALIMELGGTVTAKTAEALAWKMPDGSMRFAKSVTDDLLRQMNEISQSHVRQGLAGYDRVVGDRVEDHLARRG